MLCYNIYNKERLVAKFTLVIILTLSLLTLLVHGSQPPPVPDKTDISYPKISTDLALASQLANENTLKTARFQAKSSGIEISPDNQVEVVVEMEDGKGISQQAVRRLGGKVLGKTGYLTKVQLPLSKVIDLPGEVPRLDYVRLPHKPLPLDVEYGKYLTEGVNLTGGGLFHSKSLLGEGVKIAVIDVGFASFNYARDANEFPDGVVADKRDYTGGGFMNGSPHGTVVAEIVHDMAPSAELYLKRIDDEISLGNAVDDVISQDVDIVVHSVGWVNTNFGDGTGVIGDIVKRATDRGVLWVNAAGNSAMRHWEGPAEDSDGDGWVEFEDGKERLTVEVNYSSTIRAFLTWNDWPKSDKDFDFFLCDADDRVLASSKIQQTGTQPPAESLSKSVSPNGPYYLKVSIPQNYTRTYLEIFSFDHQLEPYVEKSSVMAPGNVEQVFTVGAINKNVWQTGPIEYFSSQGPTSDGRIKPDLTGVDGVTPFAWYGKFSGTSAAAPCVAGAAGLILSRSPDFTPEQVKIALTENAQDLGEPGKDNVYGAGKMRLIYKTPSGTRTIVPQNGDKITPGDLFTVKISATMPVTLQGGLNLEEEIPDEFEVVEVGSPDSASYSKNRISGSWGIVPPGRERELVYTVKVPEDTPSGNYEFSGLINGNSVAGASSVTVLGISTSDPDAEVVNLERIDISTDKVAERINVEAIGDNVSQVKVVVYSTTGKEIFDSGWVQGVNYQWGYHDNNGDPVANGIYILYVQVKGTNGDIESSDLQKALVLR